MYVIVKIKQILQKIKCKQGIGWNFFPSRIYSSLLSLAKWLMLSFTYDIKYIWIYHTFAPTPSPSKSCFCPSSPNLSLAHSFSQKHNKDQKNKNTKYDNNNTHAHTQHTDTHTHTHRDHIVHFVLVNSSPTRGQSWSVLIYPKEHTEEKWFFSSKNLSIAIASWLEWNFVPTSSSPCWDFCLTWLNLYKSCACYSPCEFVCTSNLLCQEDTVFLGSPALALIINASPLLHGSWPYTWLVSFAWMQFCFRMRIIIYFKIHWQTKLREKRYVILLIFTGRKEAKKTQFQKHRGN